MALEKLVTTLAAQCLNLVCIVAISGTCHVHLFLQQALNWLCVANIQTTCRKTLCKNERALNTKMPVKLYKQDFSPPARAAMMACEIFNVPAEFIEVDLLKGEHQAPEFLKKNPTHTIPVLEDGDLILHDSHAILTYLADKYGKDDSWYPKDIKNRALVNQKLYFDAAVLFTRLRNVTYPAIIEGVRKPTQGKLADIEHAYDFLEAFLTKSKYLAADHITIADVATFATVTSLRHLVPINPAKYPKTTAWIKELEKKPFAQKHNAPGDKGLEEILKKHVDL